MSSQAKQDNLIPEEYLQISSNIVSTFGNRTPVSLCIYDEEFSRVAPLFPKETRLTPKKKEQMIKQCLEGNLFITKDDYAGLAGHISQNLGALLTEHYLDETAAAEIFYSGILEKIRSFYSNPITETLDQLKAVLAIFSEYVWVDRNRWSYFFNTLRRENDLCCHSVNTLFVGTAVYLKTVHKGDEKLELNSLGLGLILHDIGMTQIPAALMTKNGPFLYKEKQRMQEHVDIAEKMINRLEIKDEMVRSCILDHHERLDGSGYPRGRRTESISTETKVCSVADAFCAMISKRWHRNGINPILAAIVLTESSKRYDKNLTSALVSFIISNNPEMQTLIKDREKMQQLRALALKQCD
ncbi:HD-GYP domain-containing protein [Maridesulfovibrio ferrireducens]|uniref:HD-GYP domain-containing protein n=1 Tax=Maridesulfovibrio ferrireducens TaxID=246191 RepID=UPI001A22A72C|nr:HD domain-containing phosphohydrolase [Maridesulfovibrio ferrireducens]MBI9113026.1 HD domain-containing protein [Maridesulfovibrio ferrireducens]